ncbi:MAG: hypothetical protein NUV93_01570 [Firmicutes bacterium]|nr:hypothetical protein [Bacillota bacterium]
MPWKRCPFCGGLSYSAATSYNEWLCPYCEKDITSAPDCSPDSSATKPTDVTTSRPED